jgi:hypothetical protein
VNDGASAGAPCGPQQVVLRATEEDPVGKLSNALARTLALTVAIGAATNITNCGDDRSRRSDVTSGPNERTAGTGGTGGQPPATGCAQMTDHPQATRFWGIWISPTGEVWVAGEDGWIGHDTSSRSGGGSWSFCQRSPGVTLRAIWGATETDVWAVGDGDTILHWQGTGWTAVADVGAPTPADLADVWGDAGAHTVWVVGRNGVARRFDGSGWHVEDADPRYFLQGVWGTATGPVRVVGSAVLPPLPGLSINGEEAVVLRRSGDSWEREAAYEHQHGAAAFARISGASDSDIWAVGVRYDAGAAQAYAFAAHFDGVSWTARAGLGVAGGPSTEQLDRAYTDVIAAPPQAPAGVLIASPPDSTLFDGGTWTTSPPELTALDRRGDALWATGAPGQVLRWTGSAWELDIGP